MGTRRTLAAVTFFVSLGGVLHAQDPPADFSGLTMDELLDVELVYAASRHAQSLRDAPSAVTIVRAAEIRRQGYRTLAELLGALPSFHVTYDRNYTYVGVRGFGPPGDYNTRILVLLNGVRLNDNVYDGVLPGHDFLLDLDLVERVEVTRGPAAALYGNSAFFAVVNVVTRGGASFDGGELAVGGGSFATLDGRGTWGRRFASGLELLGSASFHRSSGQDLFFPGLEDDETRGWARGLDGEGARRGFVQAAWRGLALQLAHSWREKEVPTGSYGAVFGDPDNITLDRLTVGSLQFDRALGKSSVFARTQLGRYRYRGSYVYEADGRYLDWGNGDWYALEAGTAVPAGRHHVSAGGELHWNTRQDQGARYEPFEPMLDVTETSRRWGLYVQDEFRIAERVTLSAGLRHDRVVHAQGTEERTSPRLALIGSRGPDTIKLLFGSAFRAANEYERHYYYLDQGPLEPETIRTLEAVWERALGSTGRLTASLFHNRISRLIVLTGDPERLSFVNSGRIDAHGLELMAERRSGDGRRLRASYTYQLAEEPATDAPLTNSPRHLAKLDGEMPLAGERLWAALNAQYVSSRRTLGGERLAAHAVVNLTLTAPKVLGSRLDLSAGAYNLFDTRFSDPGSEEHWQEALPRDGRTLRLKAAWRF